MGANGWVKKNFCNDPVAILQQGGCLPMFGIRPKLGVPFQGAGMRCS